MELKHPKGILLHKEAIEEFFIKKYSEQDLPSCYEEYKNSLKNMSETLTLPTHIGIAVRMKNGRFALFDCKGEYNGIFHRKLFLNMGGCINYDEEIHHKNGKFDNRVTSLESVNWEEHRLIHLEELKTSLKEKNSPKLERRVYRLEQDIHYGCKKLQSERRLKQLTFEINDL